MIEISPRLVLDERQFSFGYARSGGPGGQNVNKVNTRVTLFFDIAGCDELSETQKKRIYKKLASRIDKNGVLHVVCQKHRSQKANRDGAIERFIELIRESLKRKPVRRKTKVPKRAVEKRLTKKKQHSELKRQRSQWAIED